MSSESSDTPDPQTQIEELDDECNELKFECNSARDALELVSSTIGGWDRDRELTISENIKSMADVLIASIKDRDARITRLHTKLGLLLERGP